MFRANQQRKILVIDDSEIVLEVTRAALESAGHRVVTHDRAAGCVALILQEKPDLVLMDVNMPHLSGDTIVGVLGKAQPRGDTVVLLHSSLSAEILRVKAEAVGAQGFLQKTGDLFALVREVNRWLKRTPPSTGTSSARLLAAKDVGLNPSSGRMRAAPDLGTPSSSQQRAAPEFNERSSSAGMRVAKEITLSFDEEARSSGTRAVASAVSSADPAETAAAPSGTMLRNQIATVLVVDRDMAVLSAYRRHLQSDQLSVEYALSGSAALRRILAADRPDVVVCDAFMPDISGLELYRQATAAALSWRQRMVLTADVQISSSGGPFAEFKGRILVKPVSGDALNSAVRACLASGALHAGRATAT